MSKFADNYYARLGVPRDATQNEIRRTYHDAARRLHPDTNPDPAATEEFIQIQEAYEVIFDPQKRAAYDKKLPPATSPGIIVNTLSSRGALINSAEPQLFYTLLELQARPDKDTAVSTPPLNICILIDRSTSMRGERMDIVKSTAQALIKQLRPEDYISIVSFNDRAEVLIPPTRGLDLERVAARVSLLQPAGGTEILSGLRRGVQEVYRNLKTSNLNHLLIITDGHTYGDEEPSLKLADEAKVKGLTISGLGIGNEWNDKFLDALTSKTGGSSMYVSRPKDIRRFMEMKFRGINQTYAESVRVEIKDNPQVELKYVFRLQPEPTSLPMEKPLPLGNILVNEDMQVLLEFLVKDISAGQNQLEILNGAVKAEIPTQIVPVVRKHLSVKLDIYDQYNSAPPPQKIVRAMSRLTLYRMQEQARQDLAAGNIEQATRRLQHLATNLLGKGENKLASTVLLEASRLEKGNALSEEGEKRIKYGTRALLLPPGMEAS